MQAYKKHISFFILFTFCICFQVAVFGQKSKFKNNPEYDDKPLHFGYTMGLNVMDFTFGRNYNGFNGNYYADQLGLGMGFQVGMISDLRLSEYFNLRCLPSFNFGQRTIQYFSGKSVNVADEMVQEVKLESSMLDLPILIKYKAMRLNNTRPYFIAGGSVRYDLATKSKFDDKHPFVLLKPLDFYLEMGFGVDFYLEFFKFSTEIKLSLGLTDILNHKTNENNPENAVYVNSLRKLNSNILMISFHFE